MIQKLCLVLSFLMLSATVPVSTSWALDGDTKIWVSLRGGAHFFIDNDQSDIEALATDLSNPPVGSSVDFESKAWEFPFGGRLGFALTPNVHVFGLFERVPYVLDVDDPVRDLSDLTNPRSDSIRFRASANFFGAGVDMSMLQGYSSGIRVGLAGGLLKMKGNDEGRDLFQNFALEGDGYFVDLYASLEWEFNGELSFYPFLQYRVAKTTTATAADNRPEDLGDGSFFFEQSAQEFEVDYSGLQFGLELRIRAFPFTRSEG